MKFLRAIATVLIDLFFDDGLLAIATLLVVALIAVLITLAGASPLVSGGLLIGGCIGALAASVWRAARVR
jgi:hypothetical protein